VFDPRQVGAAQLAATKALNDHRKDLENRVQQPAVTRMACNVLHAANSMIFA